MNDYNHAGTLDDEITLMDRFAMNAMNGMLANDIGWTGQPDKMVKTAYDIAELMIEERKDRL